MAETTLNQRLEMYLSSKNISRKELARKWGVSKQAVTNWLTDLSQIPVKHIINVVSEYPELNARWLLIGTGDMESEVVKVYHHDYAMARKDGMIELLSRQLVDKEKKIEELSRELARMEVMHVMEKSSSYTKSEK